MIILTNCLTEVVDEGGVKVVNSLIKRIKAADPQVKVVSCAGTTPLCDVHIPSNKLLLTPALIRYLWTAREPVLYMPLYARSPFMAVRMFILSLYTRRKLRALLYMHSPIGRLAGLLLRLSGVTVIALSAESAEEFRTQAGVRSLYLQTGVDTARFVPAEAGTKAALRQKYGLPADKRIVLHVGHMQEGRNIRQLLKLDERFHALLVVSTSDVKVEDAALHRELAQKSNITIIDRYIPRIEEIYQLADVYCFPVQTARNCIDVPLSALEAAACGLPVVATPYGEMKALLGQPGFYEITSFEKEGFQQLLLRAAQEAVSPRPGVLAYDWNNAVEALLQP